MTSSVAAVHVPLSRSLPDVLAVAAVSVEPGTRFGFSRADGYRTVTMPHVAAVAVAEKFNDLVVVPPPPVPRAEEPTAEHKQTRTKPRKPQSRSRNKGGNDG